MMRALFVSGYLPAEPNFGAARRLYGLMSNLARTHSVSLLALARPRTDSALKATRAFCDEVIVVEDNRTPAGKRRAQLRSLVSPYSYERLGLRQAPFHAALDRMIGSGRFHLVQVESVLMGFVSIPPGVPVVLDEHNIEYEVLQRSATASGSQVRRIYSRIDALKLRREERLLWTKVDGCAVPSSREAAIVREAAPATPTVVVPNGVDTAAFTANPSASDGRTVLFFGSLNYYPNLDALAFLVQEVMPLLRRSHPTARLAIVGPGDVSALRKLPTEGIVYRGEVPDIRREIERAAVVVAPLRIAGGTRLKILESMAMARPVVATAIGAEGIEAAPGREILIANEPDALAIAIGRLLDDPTLRLSVGEAGRKLVESRYDWRVAAEKLQSFHRLVISAHQRSCSATLPAIEQVG
jgi:glycosyltransferase involved in cell wall biosynthesis